MLKVLPHCIQVQIKYHCLTVKKSAARLNAASMLNECETAQRWKDLGPKPKIAETPANDLTPETVQLRYLAFESFKKNRSELVVIRSYTNE
ncbi:hypothetical protein HNY73_015519 [Argiope bruennichi]|uniref:Uncharacterized protein n=1 Tax=Argiope bruennichi TaxID=94029 RepID=A0A8T0ESD1_ARGBR|nr:hypothetical protein HNY73_015519 [Argiope bruennichi]